jgi:hypothetical protein
MYKCVKTFILGRRGRKWGVGREFADKCHRYFAPGALQDKENLSLGFSISYIL